jgi:hypothetical protein
MSGLDETLRRRVAANAGEPVSIPPTTDSSSEPVPVDVERIRADHAMYVKGWADARAQAREGTGATYAILAACRVADAMPAVLAELVALRADLDAAHDEIGTLKQDLDTQTAAAFANQADLRTPDEWLAAPEYADTRIVDPDGWRGSRALPWGTPITRADFERRLAVSTVTQPATSESASIPPATDSSPEPDLRALAVEAIDAFLDADGWMQGDSIRSEDLAEAIVASDLLPEHRRMVLVEVEADRAVIAAVDALPDTDQAVPDA